ncbi:MAG: hypothetical protein A2Y45_08255 [Tenericutes bacterium GWC2_34_14]|nr:MAG: hypothetical protein A2Z84_03215 [Tenericutes bacterium GWA2_35_7]OHE29888.1 MAG: hypothetical protein A2Y45_08255 [Tenericutes bacterium GWC2_34_14]OHE34867.1 MAG: hypothetical protein A2012_01865 [Tenericutes bacterium GWE2_34_108]OHE37272.1 MAG: hypothetical protein A2Y46_01145 [Tenericutes bacterium GWF1_35_14]OHE39595.1 MAG: hypothetical protein A2Y44_01715 [Tenericutes bacterium GWF2_35_184]OHE41297.1 MAG: hypothetical protein A3K26_06350 [Tenericutes bacterium RIFOXYA12_FULL_35_
MIAYNETLDTFRSHIQNNVIVSKIQEKLGFKASDSLERSFRNSLGEMYKVLNASSIPGDAQIGIEYKIPITTKRIDFIITGSDGSNNHVVIVELKQWDKVSKTDMSNVIDLGGQPHTHPSWQAYSYAAILEHFNDAIERNDITVTPLAFLHNYKMKYLDQIISPIYEDAIKLAPVFIEDDYDKLRKFIEKYIKYPSKKNLLFEIENGKIKPSKMLVDAIGNMLNQNPEFILIDEQKIVSEYLYQIATKGQKDDKKHVIIVEGGAGTGKSVIAIDLLGKLVTKRALTTFYVAKSSYVKENYFNKLTKGVPNYTFLRTLFKGSGNFMDSLNNEFNCLIVDEAHRLTEKTKRGNIYYGVNQIMEIMRAAKVSIFFIDPKQSIDIKDFGTIAEITKWANQFNAEIHQGDTLKLKSQFRCNGSDEYMAWVDSLLYNGTYQKSSTKVDYDIQIFDDINEMKKAIQDKNTNNKARIISGDVFPWISRKDKQLIDIHLDGFSAQWNKTKAFATDPKSIDEVGCIHTTQGMEFEYIGLIVADDLIYRNNKVETDYTKHPQSANEFRRPYQKRIKSEDVYIIDQLIRNTYRVLLSRGQKGCYIYCMDKKLKSFLESELINLNISNQP